MNLAVFRNHHASEPDQCAVWLLLQSGGPGGLQGLLKAAQQKHNTAQRAPSAVSPVPASSTHAEPPMPAAGAAGLLTPAFFEQQQQQQQQRAPKPPPPAAAGGSTPVALQDTASSASAANGPGQGGNPLLGLLSR